MKITHNLPQFCLQEQKKKAHSVCRIFSFKCMSSGFLEIYVKCNWIFVTRIKLYFYYKKSNITVCFDERAACGLDKLWHWFLPMDFTRCPVRMTCLKYSISCFTHGCQLSLCTCQIYLATIIFDLHHTAEFIKHTVGCLILTLPNSLTEHNMCQCR